MSNDKPPITRYKLFTVFYDDEGAGNGTVVIDYGAGGTSLPVGAGAAASMQQQIMQRVPSEDLRCSLNLQVQKYPRDPIVVVAEEKILECGGYIRGSSKDPP